MIYLQKLVFVFPDEIRLVSPSYLYSSMRKRAIKWLQLRFDLKRQCPSSVIVPLSQCTYD